MGRPLSEADWRARVEAAEAEVRALRAAVRYLSKVADRGGPSNWRDFIAHPEVADAIRAATADPTPPPEPCTHANRAWTIGGPGDSDGYVWCPDCRTNLSDDYADPHYPDHQWVWVDGNNVDAVVIYREWQRYQRASAERWEQESNATADPTPDPETHDG